MHSCAVEAKRGLQPHKGLVFFPWDLGVYHNGYLRTISYFSFAHDVGTEHKKRGSLSRGGLSLADLIKKTL